MPIEVKISERRSRGYAVIVYKDGIVIDDHYEYTFTLWGARRKARRVLRMYTRKLHQEYVREPN